MPKKGVVVETNILLHHGTRNTNHIFKKISIEKSGCYHYLCTRVIDLDFWKPRSCGANWSGGKFKLQNRRTL